MNVFRVRRKNLSSYISGRVISFFKTLELTTYAVGTESMSRAPRGSDECALFREHQELPREQLRETVSVIPVIQAPTLHNTHQKHDHNSTPPPPPPPSMLWIPQEQAIVALVKKSHPY
jgi:hypothetical protein